MFTIHLSRSDKTVDAIIKATFPEYTGRKVEAIIRDSVEFHGTQWDEGNRRSYRVLRISDMQCVDVPTAPFMRESTLHAQQHVVAPGFVVVVHCQGRYEHIEIIGPAANVTPMLPAPVALSDNEKIVLAATCQWKSTYEGVSNYRLYSARRYVRITDGEWSAARASLVAKKFLTKAGAITIDGKNAIGNYRLGC